MSVEGHGGLTWDDWKAIAATAEATGIAGLFRSDHYEAVAAPGHPGADDAWSLLAALAVVTTTIRLGSLVSPVGFRHPSHLAKVATTVDRLSGGRVEVGLGAGWHAAEHRTYGFPFPDRATRADMLGEQLELLTRQWTEDDVSFAGAHYRVAGLTARPRPVQRPHPPIIVGGSGGRRTTELAARWATEYNTAFAGPDAAAGRRAVLDRACEAAGRDPAGLRLSVMTGCVVGDDRSDLHARARAILAARGESGSPAAFLAAKAADAWIVGTVGEVVERAGVLATAVDRLVVKPPVAEDLEMLAILGERVAPPLG